MIRKSVSKNILAFALVCASTSSLAHAALPPTNLSFQSRVDHMVQHAQALVADILYSEKTQAGLVADFKWDSSNPANGLRSEANELAQRVGLMTMSYRLDAIEKTLASTTKQAFEDRFSVALLNSPNTSAQKQHEIAESDALKTTAAFIKEALTVGKKAAARVSAEFPAAPLLQIVADHRPLETHDLEIRKIALEEASSGSALSSVHAISSDVAKYISSEAIASARTEAADKTRLTKLAMTRLSSALNEFNRKCGWYPSTSEGLDALVHNSAAHPCKNFDPTGFTAQLPKDAWGNNFAYLSNGSDFELKSFGADGSAGGQGVAADIVLKAGGAL